MYALAQALCTPPRTGNPTGPAGKVLAWIVFAVAAFCAAPAHAQPCASDANCPPGKVCIDGECRRQGLRNPLGTVDSALRRPIRRDDEILLIGPSGGTNTSLGIGHLPGEAEVSSSRSGVLPVVGCRGRLLGPTTEQLALVVRPPSGSARTLLLIDLFQTNLPTLSEYSFTPANADSVIALAAGDVDNRREPFPSEEYHHELCLVYEADDGGMRKARLVILSFEDIEPPCGMVSPPPDPTQVTSVFLATPLQNQGSAPNEMAVTIGDFDNNLKNDVAVGVINSAGQVVVELFSIEVDMNGVRSIVPFAPAPPNQINCCVAHDFPGCSSANPDNFNDCAEAVCAVPGFEYCCGDGGGVWDQGCADKARELGMTPYHACFLCAFTVPSFTTLSSVRTLELVSGPELDNNPAGPGDQIGVIAITGISGPTGSLQMQVFSYDQGDGEFQLGVEGDAQAQPDRLGMVGMQDVDVLLAGRLRVGVGSFPGAERGGGQSIAVLVDTNFGPVVQIYGFDGKVSGDSGPIYDNPFFDAPVWPTQTVLDARPMTTMNTGANMAVGNYVRFRSSNIDAASLIISEPGGPSPLFHLPFSADLPGTPEGGPDHANATPLVDPDDMSPFPVSPLPVMLATDIDGDSGYYRAQAPGGAVLFLGEPTLYSVNGIVSNELILQEPPKHVDYLPQLGGIFNISQTDDFYTQVSSTQQLEEEASTETKTDFSVAETFAYNVSVQVGFKIKVINVSVEQSVGQTFQTTHSESTTGYESETSSVTLTQVSKAERDDQLVAREAILDVWRYPVMGVVGVDDQNQPLPDEDQPVNPQYEIVIPGPPFNTFGPGRSNDDYQPFHMNSNILSYPIFVTGQFEPTDVASFDFGELGPGGVFTPTGSSDDPIWAENAFIVGGLTASLSLTFSNTITQNSTVQITDSYKETLDSKTKASVSGSKGIFSGSVTAEFNYNLTNSDSFSTTEVGRTTTSTTSEILVNVPAGIPAERGYKFFPAWYVIPGGAYKVTHAVSTTEIGQAAQVFWEENYGLPDPGLNMPHRIVADADIFGNTFYRLGTDLSRKRVKGFFVLDQEDNEFLSPPIEGEVIKLRLRVYNFSVGMPVCNLRVRFDAQRYSFGQEVGPRIFIGETIIPSIASRADPVKQPPCENVYICAADLTGDLLISNLDVAPFIQTLLTSSSCVPMPGCCAGDLTSDGAVNGADIGPFVEALLGTGGPPEPAPAGAPPNMAEVVMDWDTAGFGPPSGSGLRRWLIYATIDPLDEIPGEVHELVDRYDDPLRNAVGQPLDPVPGAPPGTYMEKGQNNTGWVLVSIAAPPPVIVDCPATGTNLGFHGTPVARADVSMAPNGLVAIDPVTLAPLPEPVTAYVNQTISLRVTVDSDKLLLKNRSLRLFDGDPHQGGQMVANVKVWGVEPGGSAQEFLTWQPTTPGRHVLYAVFDEMPSDGRPENATDTLIVDVVPRPPAGPPAQ